ncbi:MAG: hypothetical protein J4203_01650 [Candidatus Diapherotrites archaeon]|uniref:Uncharacterized protein n=2 Tax=Candidatus Iainarchaeum sp. TaxID=3101447 RepID=A0A8T4L5H3_9ARCH|nr:hypothetical protein [Candidatus Diapherotrites archaeon]
MAPNALALASAKYDEKRRAVRVFFSNDAQQSAKSFPFFPRLYVDRQQLPADHLQQALDLYGPTKFSFKTVNRFAAEVKASTHSDLVKLSRLLDSMFQYDAKPLEPERQFLLSSDWSYFDAFALDRDAPEKIPAPGLSSARLDFLSSPVSVELSELLRSAAHTETAAGFAKKIAYANLLAIPPTEAPDSASQAAELFLQNAFFRAGLPTRNRGPDFSAEKKAWPWSSSLEESSGLNFSNTLAKLLLPAHYNLGPDTLQCPCCMPENIAAKNLLPDSLVFVRFQADFFYFQSVSEAFANRFHAARPGKENRLRFKLESSLHTLPIGPFSRNQVDAVPLPDAFELVRHGKAMLAEKEASLKWHCTRAPSGLAQELARLSRLEASLAQALSGLEQKTLSENKLAAQTALAAKPDYYYLSQARSCLSDLLAGIPRQLTDKRSAFYFEALAASLEAIQALAINQFKEFALARGGKWLGSRHSRAFFCHESPWALVKDFSLQHRLPLPALELNHGFGVSRP